MKLQKILGAFVLAISPTSVLSLPAAAADAPEASQNSADPAVVTADPQFSVNTADPGVVFKKISRRNSVNDCGSSTFINRSSGGSPTVNDCRQIAINIAGGGTWGVFCEGAGHQLVQYGTCAFQLACGGGDWVNIGNSDIIDLINSSIQLFQWNGLVGSEGNMQCQVAGTQSSFWRGTWWGIYHT